MAVFWLFVVGSALGFFVFIARPLLFAEPSKQEPVPAEGSALDTQLAAIRRDLDYGLIDETSAASAEREAQLASEASEATPSPKRKSRIGRMAALAAIGAAPLAAALLYLNIGAPEALTAKQRLTAAMTPGGDAESDIATLEARAAAAPDDFNSWMALGDAYVFVGRAGDAARAFKTATTINDNDASAHSAYGEALALEANGAITGEAHAAFARALELAPDDPRARYYLAEARYQVGAVDEAARAFASLVNDAPADAPWFGAIAARMKIVATEANIALADLGLSDAAMRRMAAGEAAPAPAGGVDAAMLRIESGEASLDDWIFAASVLASRGEKDRAVEILARADARYQSAPFALAQIRKAKEQLAAEGKISLAPAQEGGAVRGPNADQAEALAAMPEVEQRQMIEGMVAGLAERLKENPDNAEGWRMLGRSYRVLGRPQESAAAWREFFKRFPQAQADDWRQFAFALIEMRPEGDNAVSAELESALVKLQEFDADDPLALFQLGHAARNRGDKAEAVRLWTRLQTIMPPDTPYAATLSRLIDETK